MTKSFVHTLIKRKQSILSARKHSLMSILIQNTIHCKNTTWHFSLFKLLRSNTSNLNIWTLLNYALSLDSLRSLSSAFSKNSSIYIESPQLFTHIYKFNLHKLKKFPGQKNCLSKVYCSKQQLSTSIIIVNWVLQNLLFNLIIQSSHLKMFKMIEIQIFYFENFFIELWWCFVFSLCIFLHILMTSLLSSLFFVLAFCEMRGFCRREVLINNLSERNKFEKLN